MRPRPHKALGWQLDNDRTVDDNFRTIQFTPPHSQSSTQFGTGLTTAEPGSVDRLMLSVDNIDSARSDLINRGVYVTEVYHYAQRPGRSGEIEARVPGPDPDGARTSPTRRSPIRTATAGCCSRSRLGFPAANGRLTPTWRPWRICCMTPPSITTRLRKSPHHTAGGTGTGIHERTRDGRTPGRPP
jgi:hypothetical protein